MILGSEEQCGTLGLGAWKLLLALEECAIIVPRTGLSWRAIYIEMSSLLYSAFSHEKGYSAPLIECIGIDGFQSPDAITFRRSRFTCVEYQIVAPSKMERKKL